VLEELPCTFQSFNRFASFKTFKSFKLEQSQVGPNNPYNLGFVESNLVLAVRLGKHFRDSDQGFVGFTR
jgi:hypothetical protein